MSDHKPIITSGQLFVLLLVGRLALTVLYSSRQSGSVALWEMLVPLLLWIPLGLLLLLPSLRLFVVSRQSVCGYCVQYFGVVGKGISLLYGGYFLYAAFNSLVMVRQFMTDVLPEGVHANMILLLLLFGCLYAAGKDVEAIARAAFLVLWLVVAAVMILAALLMPGFSAERLTPIRYLSGTSVLDGILLLMSRMSASVSLNTLLPSVKGYIRRHAAVYVVGFCGLVSFLVILFVGSTGDYLNHQSFPMFRAIDGSAVLQRLDPFFILVMVCSLFCHVTLLLIALTRSVRSITDRLPVPRILLSAGILLAGGILLWSDSDRFLMSIPPYGMAVVSVILMAGIPLCLLLHQKILNSRTRLSKTVHRKRRRAFLLLPFFLLCTMSSGCSGLQLNQRIIVQGIGIDRQEQGYELTLLTLDTRDPHQDNAMTIIHSQGTSVEDAVRRLENRSGKKLLLHQCLFVMMDRQAACHTDQTLSYFAEMREIPKTVNLMVSEQTCAAALMTAVEAFGDRSEDINALSDSKAIAQPVAHCTLLEYITVRSEQPAALVFPYVVIQTANRALTVSGSYWVNGEDSGCTLSEEETNGYLLLKGEDSGLFPEAVETVQVMMLPSVRQQRLHLDYHIALQWKDGTTDTQQHLVQQEIDTAASACLKKLLQQNGCDVLSVEQVLRNSLPYFDGNGDDMKKLLRTAAYTLEIHAA